MVLLPLTVLLLGLCVSGAAALWLTQRHHALAEAEFGRMASRIKLDLRQRFQRPAYGLRGLAGLYAASPHVDRAMFRAFVESRDLPREFPGVRGFGFIQPVQRHEVEAFAAAQRLDGAPEFTVRELDSRQSANLYVIKFIEPKVANQGAAGLDVGSEVRRRVAAEQAIASGESTLTASIILVQDKSRRAGLLLYGPIYRHGAKVETPAQRQDAIIGLLYAPIVVSELLEGLLSQDAGRVSVEWREREDPSAESDSPALFTSVEVASNLAHVSQHSATIPMALHGRDFILAVRSTALFDASANRGAHWWVLAGGSLVSLLLAGLLWQESRSRRRAEHLAVQMTAEVDRLALVARRTSNAVVITNAQRQITWVNEGFERITGYNAADVIGRTPGHVLQFEGTDPAEVARLRAALNSGQGHHCKLLNRGKHGQVYWLEIEIQPLHDRTGEFVGFMAIETEITERVQAQEALRASQDLLDKTGRIGSVGGWACELATGRMAWTAQTSLLLDLEPGVTLTPAQCLAFCTPQARQQVDEVMARGCFENHCAWDIELPLITAKGRAIWVRVIAECERIDGRPVRVVGALQDITARRAMQAEVERSAQLLRGAIDAIDEAFVLFDPEDRLVLFNEKYLKTYAQSADLLQVGARFEDIIRGGAERGQYKAAVGRVDAWVAERMANHRAGNTTVVQHLDSGRVMRVLEQRMPDGHLVGFRVDITDLVRATEAAEQASQAKSEFIATISHELRTPLQSVIGFSELGEHFAQDQPSFREMFADINAGGQRMLKLVNDLLDISKFTGALVQLDLRPGDLAEVCAAVVREFEPILGQRSVHIDRPSPWPALPVAIDRFRLQQVLRNVLANAVRFTPPGSRIRLDLADHGDEGVTLSVSDEGPGIPEDELDDIFEPFTQSSRTRDGSGGTGLGLTICRKIMTAHGGHIEAANAAGRGALITLRLPALAPTSQVPQVLQVPQVPQVPQDMPHETHHPDH